MAKNKGSKRPHERLGRPPKELAGDVETRILDAAQRVFLAKGYQSSTIDEVAELAPASKPTIYAHFARKEALFAQVVRRIIDGFITFESYTPEGRTMPDKLTSLGIKIAKTAIDGWVDVIRVTMAEAQKFPELSSFVHEATRNRTANAVSHILDNAAQMPSRGSKRQFNKATSRVGAQIFIDLIVLPALMRSLIGDEAATLRKELPSFVRERISFFLRARGSESER